MKLSFSQRTWSSVGVAALVLMLGLLALLQYRWSRDVSEAAGARMRANLQSSISRFREDFARELGNLAATIQTESDSPDDAKAAADYVRRIDAWKRISGHPDLLQNVYIFEANGDKSRLVRLNLVKASFEPTAWPLSLDSLKEPLSSFSSDIAVFDHHHREARVDHLIAMPPIEPQGQGERRVRENWFFRSDAGLGGKGDVSRGRPERGPDGPGPERRMLPRLPWMFEEANKVLIHFQVSHPEVQRESRGPEFLSQPGAVSWIIIELNENVVRDQMFPQLTQAHFSGADGLEYDVVVVDRSRGDNVIYASSPGFRAEGSTKADAEASMVGGFDGPPGGPGAIHSGPDHVRTYAAFPGFVHIEHFRFGDRGPGWVLMAKHRKGSLEAALASMHRRQLAISFGVLALLGVTMLMIIVATRRAQRLAKLQMDFVAGVSHELRTPLAVIGSAAENIADGIIEDKSKLKRYGAVIRDQSRHLTQLVEQILLFAAARQNGYKFNLVRADAAELVKGALDNSAELIRKEGVTVEQHVDADLPQVMVDVPAVTHCLQNLIANAVKYGGDNRWIGVTAEKSDGEILISVTDKGIGIAGADLSRIFEPFYRSPEAMSAQIHGTGLGLALAKGIAEAMKGRLSVKSQQGVGSTFTLHLPAQEPTAAENDKEKAEMDAIR